MLPWGPDRWEATVLPLMPKEADPPPLLKGRESAKAALTIPDEFFS